jgi:hypothetical protein
VVAGLLKNALMPCVSVFQSHFENGSLSANKRHPQKKKKEKKKFDKSRVYFLLIGIIFLEEARSLINHLSLYSLR